MDIAIEVHERKGSVGSDCGGYRRAPKDTCCRLCVMPSNPAQGCIPTDWLPTDPCPSMDTSTKACTLGSVNPAHVSMPGVHSCGVASPTLASRYTPRCGCSEVTRPLPRRVRTKIGDVPRVMRRHGACAGDWICSKISRPCREWLPRLSGAISKG